MHPFILVLFYLLTANGEKGGRNINTNEKGRNRKWQRRMNGKRDCDGWRLEMYPPRAIKHCCVNHGSNLIG